ncbi:polymer-forming cytoskeletal protein [Halobacteriales archaeon QS_1_67_19]|nr:MAG: polymer-forming cytoskeletal protein [Halobacteriales archaeon QS_1_67_19]
MDNRFAAFLAVLVVLAGVPAPVAADETRSGGTVVVEEGETVDDDLTVYGGTAIIRGTVNGNLTAFTGNVYVPGEVDGDLEAFSGNVRINGTVTGNANAFSGNVFLAESGRVGGQLQAAGGNVVVNGEVGGDVQAGAGTITVGPTAVVGGDLLYDGELSLSDEARIDGETRQESDTGGFSGPSLPSWFGFAYGFVVHLLLGAVALLAFPRFSRGLAGRAASTPLRSGGVGLLLFLAVPILAVLLFVSVIGIPLGLLVLVLYPFLLWLGFVYGAYAVGAWLLSLASVRNRWAGLLVGLAGASVAGLVPVVGGLLQFLVLLIGLGALGRTLVGRYRDRRATRATADI